MTKRVVDTSIEELLVSNGDFEYAHLIKFERPFDQDPNSPNFRTNANRYAYFTDASRDINFNDGSTDQDGNGNGSQVYRANRVLSVGQYSETTSPRAISVGLTLAGEHLGTSISVRGDFSNGAFALDSNNLVNSQIDLVEEGFREGDKIKFTKNSGTFSTGDSSLTYIITGFSNSNRTFALTTTGNDSDDDTSYPTDTNVNVTISLESEELKAALLDRSGVSLANPTFLNRECFIHKVFIDPETGDLVGNTSILLFKGIISSCSIEESLTGSKIKWSLSSHWADWAAVTGRLTTDEVHRALNAKGQPDSNATIRPEYAYDLGFLHAETTLNQIANYSTFREEITYKTKKRGGVAGVLGQTKLVEVRTTVEDINEVDLQIGLQGKYLPVVYGVQRVAGIPVFADTTEDASNIVYVVHALSEGEIHGLYNFYVDGVPIICTDKSDYDVRNSTNGTDKDNSQLQCYGRADQGDTVGGQDTADYALSEAKSEYSEQFFQAKQISAEDDPEARANILRYLLRQTDAHYQTLVNDDAPNLTATDALGLQHQQWAQITDPHNLSLTLFAGRSTQKASSMLVTQAEGTGNNGKFKRQADYYDSDLPYWGPDHRLLDTAYVVGAYVISEDQTTVPEIEYTIKGKVFENYNYDNSYLPDSILGSSDDHTNFSEGDDVTVERSTDGSTWTQTSVEGTPSDTSFRILHKYLLSTSRGTTHQRFILDQTPDLDESDGVPTYTYLRLKSGSNYWHMRTWNHKAVDGANFALYTFNPSSVTVNGDNKIQLTFSTADANLLKAGYTDEISSSPAKVSYSFKVNNVSALGYLADNSIVGTWSGDTITLDAKYDSALNGGTAIGSITDVLTIEMFKNRNFFFGGSGGAITDFTSSAELEGATITIDQTGESRIIDSFDATNKRIEIEMPFVTLTEANHDSGLTFSIQGTFSDKRAGNNPAMQLLDYLSSNRYGRKLDINEDIDLASFKSSAKLCDVRSDQTIALTTNASSVAVGDIYKLTSDGTSSGTHVASGTVKEVTTTTLGGSTVSKITFEKMSHQFGREYQNYISYVVGEHILTTDGNVYKVTSAGYKATKPVHTSGTVNGLEYISAGTYTLNKVSGDGPSSVTVNATFGTVYSLYSADFIKYWRYLGWEHHKQCFVTRHQTNFIIGTDKSLFENVNAFLSHFNGLLSYEGGKYVLDVETQVSTPSTVTSFNSVTYDWNVNPEYIDSSDIIGSISLTDNSQRTSKNTIKASIQDPQNNFGSRSVSFFNSDYLKADRNVVKTGQWEYSGITNYYNARIGCEKELLQSRYSREISFTVGPKGLLLKAGQVIAVTYEPFGFSSKLFRIENLNFNADCNVQVKAREYDNSIYVISSQRASELRQETATQAAPVKAPAAPTSLSATTNKPGSVILTWTNPSDFVDESDDIEIWASSDNNRANAELIYVSKNEATRFTYTTADAGTNYYWIRTRRRGQKQNGKPKLVRSAYHPSGATNGVTGSSKPSSPALVPNINNIILRFDADGVLDPSGAAQDTTITVTKQNLTGTPTIQILDADGSSQSDVLFTDTSTSITGLTATVDASTASTSTTAKIVKISLTESGDTYTYTIPLGIVQQGRVGSDGADGKTVKLTPSKSVINYSTDDTESDTITFTTDVSGFTTPKYRFLVDGTESQALSTTPTFTLPDADEPAIGGTTVVKVEVEENNEGSVLATDTVTIFAVQDGSDAIIGFLTNGAHTVQADSSGTVSSFSGAGGTYKVFVGGTDVTTSCTFSVVSETGVDVSINGSSGVYSVSSMSANQGTATFQAVIPAATAGTSSNVTITAEYSISKSIAGANGGDGDPGLRTIQGYLYYEKTTAGAPTAPSGNTYTFSTGLVSGTGINDSGTTNVWKNSPNTQDATSSNKYYTVRYYGTEAAAEDTTISVNYSSVVQQTDFSGVVTFSGGTFQDGGTDITTIDGGNITTGSITAGTYVDITGPYSDTGIKLDLDNGSIETPYFYSNDSAAGFKGTLTIGSTNLTSNNTLNENTTPANVSSNMTGVTLTSSGQIYSGKSTYGSGTGWLMEYNSGTPRFDIGNTSNYMRWTGSALQVKGSLTIAGSSTELTENNTLNENTTATQVGLGNVENKDSSGQIQAAWDASTLIDSGKIKLAATSGTTTNYIEIDATNGRILIADDS